MLLVSKKRSEKIKVLCHHIFVSFCEDEDIRESRNKVKKSEDSHLARN